MRRVFVLALLCALSAACGPHHAEFAWDAPRGQWTVDAHGGHTDVDCELTNHGPAAVELLRVAPVDGPDFSSIANLLSSVLPADADAATKVRRLNELVHRWLRLGSRSPFAPFLFDQPLRVLTVAGQGYTDDFARVLAALLAAAGLDARVLDLKSHAGVVVRWDGAWHLADPYFGVVFAANDGAPATLRELAIDPELIRSNLDRAPQHDGREQAAMLYRRGIKFDDESAFRRVTGAATPLRPWPLPAGASVRFNLAGAGPREGRWSWTLPDDRGRFVLPSLTADGWQATSKTLTCSGADNCRLRLTIDLPFPLTRLRVRVRFARHATPGRTEIYIYGPQEGPAGSTRLYRDRPKSEVAAERRWPVPLDGAASVAIDVLSPGAELTGLTIEADFLHAPAAAPHVAGARRTIIGEVRANGPAQLVTRHEWR